MKIYDEALAAMLRGTGREVMVQGHAVRIKPIPDDARPGVPDPREWAYLQALQAQSDKPLRSLQEIRESQGFPNRNLNTVEIHTKYEEMDVGARRVGLWRYYPRKPEGKTGRPAMLFLHGGGWNGGSVYTVENACRLLAEWADAVVFAPEYSLAPDHPFPQGLEDCHAALRRIHQNAAAYGIDPSRIGVAGDGAGGNLAAALALADRDAAEGLVAYQALIYPVLTFCPFSTPDYRWSLDQYEISEPYRELLIPQMVRMSYTAADPGAPVWPDYLPDQTQRMNPYASPLLAQEFSGLPRTLMISSQYSGVRIQDELYAAKLADAGVCVRTLRYAGLGHSFLDRLGVQPQAEDVIREIAEDMKSPQQTGK
ncbi:MAG: alpha/beta hydrolase fold domain-containing protein [Eubacteriales bacterium]|nr:alpha/beta hydrolase fold domain-containing protein [Eubacteriales bacterium]